MAESFPDCVKINDANLKELYIQVTFEVKHGVFFCYQR